jgi:hypothetical protein
MDTEPDTLLVGKVFLYTTPDSNGFNSEDFMNHIAEHLPGFHEVKDMMCNTDSYAITIDVRETTLTDEEMIANIEDIANTIGYASRRQKKKRKCERYVSSKIRDL